MKLKDGEYFEIQAQCKLGCDQHEKGQWRKSKILRGVNKLKAAELEMTRHAARYWKSSPYRLVIVKPDGRAVVVIDETPEVEQPSLMTIAQFTAGLRELANDDQTLWEVARAAIEEQLIEMRDSRMSMGVNRRNGLVIYEKNGQRSDIIRFGPEVAVKIALLALANHLETGDDDA